MDFNIGVEVKRLADLGKDVAHNEVSTPAIDYIRELFERISNWCPDEDDENIPYPCGGHECEMSAVISCHECHLNNYPDGESGQMDIVTVREKEAAGEPLDG